MSEIMVSVLCTAYNHEKYIRDALEGFVMQKTTFPFEVLVHDDASTDHTADIIREYEAKYPDIIKPIYQSENQYSQKIPITRTFLLPKAKGKYIALCEGDDYWTDENKLQMQVDYMEAHPKCTLCFTNAQLTGSRQGRMIQNCAQTKYLKDDSFDYNMGEMALLDFVPTASLLYPKSIMNNAPTLRKGAYSGDTFIRLYTTSCGYAHYIDEETCVYRTGVPGSATTRWNEDNELFQRIRKSMILMFQDMNAFTNYQFDSELSEMIALEEYYVAFNSNDMAELRKKKYREYAFRNGKKTAIKYILKAYFPRTFRFLKNMKYTKFMRHDNK